MLHDQIVPLGSWHFALVQVMLVFDAARLSLSRGDAKLGP